MADAGAPACEGERTVREDGERTEREERVGREWRDEKERKAYKHMFVRKRGEGREHIQVTSERMEVSRSVYTACTTTVYTALHHCSVYWCTTSVYITAIHFEYRVHVSTVRISPEHTEPTLFLPLNTQYCNI